MQAVLRYLIRVFEIKGGTGSCHALHMTSSQLSNDQRGRHNSSATRTSHIDDRIHRSPAPSMGMYSSHTACSLNEMVPEVDLLAPTCTGRMNSMAPSGSTNAAVEARKSDDRKKGDAVTSSVTPIRQEEGWRPPVGIIVHRTKDVRFQCHVCGQFYSWESSIRHHYERIHGMTLPEDEKLYILPWERKRYV